MNVGDSYNPKGLFTGIFIPESMVRLSNEVLSLGAKLCFGRLCWHMNDDDECFPSREKLAEEIGVSVSSVRDYLRELEDAGFIRRERSGPRANYYEFAWHSALETSLKLKKRQTAECLSKKPLMDSRVSLDGQPAVSPSLLVREEEREDKNKYSSEEFLVDSGKLPGRKYSGRDKKRIKEFWKLEWEVITFDEVLPLVDRELNKAPRASFQSKPRFDDRRSFPRPTSVAVVKRVIVGDCPIFKQYIQIFILAGKTIGDAEREEAWPLWEPLTEDQKLSSGRDAARICKKTADPDWIPAPANHLKKKPWTRETIERVLPVPAAQMSKQDQARALARAKGYHVTG